MRGEQHDWPKFMARIPPDLKVWLAQQAEKYGTSQNSEIVRAIRERADRTNETVSESVGALAKA
jgi:predicted HicB family RNase H-like nuclease